MSGVAESSKAVPLTGSTFDAYNGDVQGAALKATKFAVALPADINFNRTVDNDFAEEIDACSERALRLTNSLLELAATSDAFPSRVKGKRRLEDREDVVDSFGSLVVDVLDHLFERVDMNLDEYLGRVKSIAVPVKPNLSSQTKVSKSRSGRLDPSILHAADLPKPQLRFKTKMDNNNGSVPRPKLKHKYNAQVPLGYSLESPAFENDGSGPGSLVPQNSHPYFYEIKDISYPRYMFEHRDLVSPAPLESTPWTWIDTTDDLQLMLEMLRHAREIAVDLEHHSYRSFSGFLCLMQISTREEDFIVDTLALREELEDLNEVFTDPRIVKVFHGAESDVIWLQQNFNVYIVNLFDTYHASKLLDFPRHGLGTLLEMYCDFVPDKRYQLADWRIRPLPEEMLKYARADTHFLLYVYDNLCNVLLDRARGDSDLMRIVLDRSQETALRVYEPEVYDFEDGTGPGGWNTLITKWGWALSGLPLVVFRAVHSWRDSVARTEDESTRFVLPNHYLFQLAERPPADMASLLALFRPVPPLVRTKAASLLDVIRGAVGDSLPMTGSDKENQQTGQSRTNAQASCERILPAETSSRALVPIESTSTRKEELPSSLWKRRSADIAAASSSLLGPKRSVAKTDTSQQLSACSTLFPTGWTSRSAECVTAGTCRRYQEVLSRIHGTLVVAPVVPNASESAIEAEREVATVTATNFTGLTHVSTQADSPLNPASQQGMESSVTTMDSADTIVTVGRVRDKKRKRSKQQDRVEKMDKGAPIKKSKNETTDVDEVSDAVEMEGEEFDYNSVPNFLDQAIMHQPVPLKPQRGKASKERRGIDYGGFPAPPRAYNEVRGANVSHTFRK